MKSSPRTPIWKSIYQTLSSEIADGRYRPGDKLPTEAALSERFGVNRHTVRRALSEMAREGSVHSRRGAGVFVLAAPTLYPIGNRVRFHQNLAASGQSPAKQILHLEHRAANAREAKALGIKPGDGVNVYEGLSLADDVPIALFRSVFPASLFPNMLEDLGQTTSVTKALQRGGVKDYIRLWTRLNAKTARATQALHLRIAEGSPILRTIGVNQDEKGRLIEYGTTWFAGDRVTLSIQAES